MSFDHGTGSIAPSPVKRRLRLEIPTRAEDEIKKPDDDLTVNLAWTPDNVRLALLDRSTMRWRTLSTLSSSPCCRPLLAAGKEWRPTAFRDDCKGLKVKGPRTQLSGLHVQKYYNLKGPWYLKFLLFGSSDLQGQGC